MSLDTPRTTELPHIAPFKRARTILIAVAAATDVLGLRHRLAEPAAGVPELRLWDPERGGPTIVVRADPDRRVDGLGLLVRVGDRASFLPVVAGDAAKAAQRIAGLTDAASKRP